MKRELVERELTEEGPRRGSGVAKRKRSVTVNLAESPLGWLHSRGHLDDRQFDAGERLRLDYERAQLAPSVTMRWDPVRVDGGSGGADLSYKIAPSFTVTAGYAYTDTKRTSSRYELHFDAVNLPVPVQQLQHAGFLEIF